MRGIDTKHILLALSFTVAACSRAAPPPLPVTPAVAAPPPADPCGASGPSIDVAIARDACLLPKGAKLPADLAPGVEVKVAAPEGPVAPGASVELTLLLRNAGPAPADVWLARPPRLTGVGGGFGRRRDRDDLGPFTVEAAADAGDRSIDSPAKVLPRHQASPLHRSKPASMIALLATMTSTTTLNLDDMIMKYARVRLEPGAQLAASTAWSARGFAPDRAYAKDQSAEPLAPGTYHLRARTPIVGVGLVRFDVSIGDAPTR
jgi:hypothetical protein